MFKLNFLIKLALFITMLPCALMSRSESTSPAYQTVVYDNIEYTWNEDENRIYARGMEGLVNGLVSRFAFFEQNGETSKKVVSYISDFNIQSLESIVISQLNVDPQALIGAKNLKRIYLANTGFSDYSTNKAFLDNIPENTVVYTYYPEVLKRSSNFKGEIKTLTFTEDLTRTTYSVRFKVCEDLKPWLKKVLIGESILSNDYTELTADADGYYSYSVDPDKSMLYLQIYTEQIPGNPMLNSADLELPDAPVPSTQTTLKLEDRTQTTLTISYDPKDEYRYFSQIALKDYRTGTLHFFPEGINTIKLENLVPNEYYWFELIGYKDNNTTLLCSKASFHTLNVYLKIDVKEITYTGFTFSYEYDPGDASIKGWQNDLEIKYITDFSSPQKGVVTIDNLFPNTQIHMLTSLLTTDNESFSFYSEEVANDYITTKKIEHSENLISSGPTSLVINWEYDTDLDGIEIYTEYIKLEYPQQVKYLSYKKDGNKRIATGQSPNFLKYCRKIQLYLILINKKYDTRKHLNLCTYSSAYNNPGLNLSDLELKILPPKCVTQNSAIVSATTNIAEEETNVGFQWRKYEAPESLPSSEGYAPACEGLLEGYIHNLQPTSYYKVRAFYHDNDGNYYTSDWATFDPSDFSYFDPTVRTYTPTEISHDSANVKGYVLRGSDEIINQGFQYWIVSQNVDAKAIRQINSNEGVMTILATGQVMTATLRELEPDTEYIVRSFAETASGTIYGDETSFRTEPLSGVRYIYDTDSPEPKSVIGYYDLSGRRYDRPQKGYGHKNEASNG